MHTHYKTISEKLQKFKSSYYLNTLLEGTIKTLIVGTLLTVGILVTEYFLWMSSTWRNVFLYALLLSWLLLFARYMLMPLMGVLNLKSSLTDEDAARIVGSFNPEIGDKLLNVLQLQSSNKGDSSLLLAAIESSSAKIRFHDFNKSIDIPGTLKESKWMLLPVALVMVMSVFTGSDWMMGSANRLSQPNVAFVKPAPFEFLIPDSLFVKQFEDFELKVSLSGKSLPSTMKIFHNGQEHFMLGDGNTFSYTFRNVTAATFFYVQGEGYNSSEHQLKIAEIPEIIDVRISVKAPAYTGVKDFESQNLASVDVVEGADITWWVESRYTDDVFFITNDSIVSFSTDYNVNDVRDNFKYSLSVDAAPQDQMLGINVVKDEYPVLDLEFNNELYEWSGLASDDYGLSLLEVLFLDQKLDLVNRKALVKGSKSGKSYAFKWKLDKVLKQAVSYSNVQFRVVDNDALHGGKERLSKVFAVALMDEEEYLLQQSTTLANEAVEVDKAINKGTQVDFDVSQKELLEKGSLTWEEQQQLQEQLETLKDMRSNYDELSKKFNALDKEEGDNAWKERLKESLDGEQSDELDESLKSIEELMQKMDWERLQQQLEDLDAKKNNSVENLNRTLKMLQRYHFEQKIVESVELIEEMKQALEKSSEQGDEKATQQEKEPPAERDESSESVVDEQSGAKNTNEGPSEEQLEKRLEQLERLNEEYRMNQDMDELNQQMKELKSTPESKSAQRREKLQQMQKKLEEMIAQNNAQQMKADLAALRKMLENSLTLSFKQEEILAGEDMLRSDILISQSALFEQYHMLRDSVYSLAMRNPFIKEQVFKTLFDIDKQEREWRGELERDVYQKTNQHQRYTLQGFNDLAVLFNQIIQNIREQLQQGQGGGPSKPQLSQAQKQLRQQMQQMMQEQQKNREQGQQQDGEGQGEQEKQNSELFQLIKKQEEMRQRYEKEGGEKGDAAERLMEEIKQELIKGNINKKVERDMLRLEQRFLKFEEAQRREGERKERQAESAKKQLSAPGGEAPAKMDGELIERLKYYELPLQKEYRKIENKRKK